MFRYEVLLKIIFLQNKPISININFTGNSAKLEDSSTSCAKMKKAGHMESEVYTLKNPDDKWPRIAYCDMQSVQGYEDNGMESLIGYINTSPEPNQIIFSAWSNKEEQIPAPNYINFDHFYITNGDYFDLASGVFTAPVKGTYEFTMTGHAYSNKNCYIQILKNEVEMQEIYTGNYFDAASTTLIMPLNINDKVRLKVRAYTCHSDDGKYRTFSGKLLEIS